MADDGAAAVALTRGVGGDRREQQAAGERGDVGRGGEVGRLLAVDAVGVEAGGDARGVGRERRAGGVAGLDAAALGADGGELEGAAALEVGRPCTQGSLPRLERQP